MEEMESNTARWWSTDVPGTKYSDQWVGNPLGCKDPSAAAGDAPIALGGGAEEEGWGVDTADEEVGCMIDAFHLILEIMTRLPMLWRGYRKKQGHDFSQKVTTW